MLVHSAEQRTGRAGVHSRLVGPGGYRSLYICTLDPFRQSDPVPLWCYAVRYRVIIRTTRGYDASHRVSRHTPIGSQRLSASRLHIPSPACSCGRKIKDRAEACLSFGESYTFLYIPGRPVNTVYICTGVAKTHRAFNLRRCRVDRESNILLLVSCC